MASENGVQEHEHVSAILSFIVDNLKSFEKIKRRESDDARSRLASFLQRVRTMNEKVEKKVSGRLYSVIK